MNHSNMFRSSMRSSSGSFFLFISLSLLLILKIIKIFKKCYHSVVVSEKKTYLIKMQSETVKKKIVKPSFRSFAILRGEVGSWIPTFRYNLSVQYSRAKQSKPIKVLAIHKFLILLK
jgi:hypothetical protein